MNEYPRNPMLVELLMACDQLENAQTIQQVLGRYGRTPEIVEMIGTEVLDNIDLVVQAAEENLGLRLKNLARDLVQKVAATVEKYRSKHITNAPYLNRIVAVEYEPDKVAKVVEKKYKSSVHTQPLSEQWSIIDMRQVLQQEKQKNLADYRKMLAKSKRKLATRSTKTLLGIASAITSDNLNRALSLKIIAELFGHLRLESGSCAGAKEAIDAIVNHQSNLHFAFSPRLQVDKLPATGAIRWLAELADFMVDLGTAQYRMLARVEIDLVEACHQGQKLVHVVEPMPPAVTKDLNDFFGKEGLTLRYCIISNMYGNFAEANAKGEFFGGFSKQEGGYCNKTLSDVWINANFLNSKLARAFHMGALTAHDAMLQVLVHESRHNYDGQHKRIGKIVDPHHDKNGYLSSPHESAAQEAERNMPETPALRLFIKAVLKTLSQAYRHRAQYLRDNARLERELESR